MTVPIEDDIRRETAQQPRFRMSISTALMLGFGLLVFTAAASVLGIGLWSASINTIQLVRDRDQLSIDLMEQQLRGHIESMMEANKFVARLIAAGNIDPNDKEALGEQIRISLAATPQVISAVLIASNFQATLVSRVGENLTWTTEDWRQQKGIQEAIIEGQAERQPFGGSLIWADRIKATLLNRRAPIFRSGKFLGAFATSVAISDLSRYLTTLDTSSENSRSFLLYGDNYVLAHPNMASGSYSRDKNEPIPHLTKIGDPVLENIWNKGLQRRGIGSAGRTQGSLA